MYKELINFLNSNDTIISNVSAYYFEKSGLEKIGHRIRWYYNADFSMIRPLRDIFIRKFDLKADDFLKFYQEVYLFRGVPHYEDIWSITTFIIIAIITLLSPIAGIEYDRWKKKNNDKQINDWLSNKLDEQLILWRNIQLLYFLRELFYSKIINIDVFHEYRELLENNFYANIEEFEFPENIAHRLKKFENKFYENKFCVHPLYNCDYDDISAIIKLLLNDSANESKTQIELPQSFNKKSYISCKSLSSGIAIGKIRVIKNEYQVKDKYIRNGDIAYLYNPSPSYFSYINMKEKPEAIICYGNDEHIKIICNTLELPAVVVETEMDDLDNTFVCVDSIRGRIYPDINMGDIREILIKQQ